MNAQATSNFQPQVGDRCHIAGYTDIRPCTVIARTAKQVTVRVDTAELTKAPTMVPGGFCGTVIERAEWQCKDDMNGYTIKFSLRANGHWVRCGSSLRGSILSAGWLNYFDYGF